MKISVMTYTLASRPDLYSVERYPEIIANAGAKGINWVTLYGQRPERILELTRNAGIEIGAFTFALQSFRHGGNEAKALKEAEIRFGEAAAIGAPVVMIVPMPIDGISDLAETRRRWCALIQQLALLAKKANTIMTIEDFDGPNSAFLTAAELLEAHRAEPSLRFTFDIGNAALAGDPAACADALGTLVAYVHLKDWHVSNVYTEGALQGRNGHFFSPAPIGGGQVDILSAIRILKKHGYDGFADIEYAGREITPETAIANAVKWYNTISSM